MMKTLLNNPSNLTRGYITALISTLFLSTTAIFIRYLTLTYQMPPLVLAFWRDVFVVMTLLVVFFFFYRERLRLEKRCLAYLVMYGLVLAIFNAFWTISVALNGAAISTVLVYSSTGFTAILGWWFLKEGLGWAKILAVGLCFGGCVLVSGIFENSLQQVNLAGIITGVLAGLSYAIYSLMGRSASQRGLNSWTTIFYTFGFAALFLLGANLLFQGVLPGAITTWLDFFWLGDALPGWAVLFLLGAAPTVLGFGLYNMSLTYLPSSVVSLIVTLEPVYTAVIAYALFGERLAPLELWGGALILSGVVFIRVYEGRAPRSLDAQPSGELGKRELYP